MLFTVHTGLATTDNLRKNWATALTFDTIFQVPWHPCVTGILKRMHEWHKTGDNSSSDYWMMKAVAQQFDLRIYHAKDAKVVKADLALLLGEAISCNSNKTMAFLQSCVCVFTSL